MPKASTTTAGSLFTDTSAFMITASGKDSPLLRINFDGSIVWNGPPSKASKRLISSLSSILDLDALGDIAAARIYRKAMERCLKKAKSMEKDELIKELEAEIGTRLGKSVLRQLRSERGV